MVGKLLIGRDFATQQEGGVRLSRSDTQLEYGDSVNGTAFPEVWRETNSRSSREREAVLLLHDTLPQVVKASALYYKNNLQ